MITWVSENEMIIWVRDDHLGSGEAPMIIWVLENEMITWVRDDHLGPR